MFSKVSGLIAGVCLCAGGFTGVAISAVAQQSASELPPPKVLVAVVEELKPGKSGAVHEKAENAFQVALKENKSNTHYLAMNSLSGPPRAIFLYRYDSFAAWEKAHMADSANPALASALDSADAADGELLENLSYNAYSYREEMSNPVPADMAKMRYMDITRITVKPGHRAEWEEYMKLSKAAVTKVKPNSRWTTYQSEYGWQNGGIFLIFRPLHSLDEVDARIADTMKVREATGDGAKRVAELAASCIESSQRNLFAFDPQMSYVPEDWAKSDSFWKKKGE